MKFLASWVGATISCGLPRSWQHICGEFGTVKEMEFQILKHIEELEPYLDQVTAAADQNRESLGFLPWPAYRTHAIQGKLWVCVDDTDEYCGHLLFGGKPLALSIIQLFVHKNYRRNGVGQRLLVELEAYGGAHNCS